uniref:Uncharacterized protein n=1 Tax=Arundo donax TaxID=35708 RepID=A0A0A9A3Z5_ARUDO
MLHAEPSILLPWVLTAEKKQVPTARLREQLQFSLRSSHGSPPFHVNDAVHLLYKYFRHTCSLDCRQT